MKKRFRDRWLVNFGLLIGVSVLIIILFLGKEAPEPPPETLSTYLPSDISQIEIIRTGREKITFKKEATNWRMLNPYIALADQTRINMLLSMKNLAVSAEFDSKDILLDNFGLKQPTTIIQFNNTRLAFGDSQPVNKQRYIQLGTKVMLIADNLDTQLNTNSISFIDRHLVADGKNIEHIEIAGQSVGDNASPENTSGQVFIQWQTIKANWISMGTENNTRGINVKITLAGQEQPLVYRAQKRDVDLVLISADSNLEYHLPKRAIETLGLVFPQETKQAQ